MTRRATTKILFAGGPDGLPVEVEESVFSDASLLEPDRNFGGMKPRRSFLGPRYLGGVSDHLPLVLLVKFD